MAQDFNEKLIEDVGGGCFRLGYSLASCPFGTEDPRFAVWRRGWLKAADPDESKWPGLTH